MFCCQSIADVGGRSCLCPGPSQLRTPLPAAPAALTCRSPGGAGGERDGGVGSFDDFNYQIFFASGWKTGIRAPLEPGSMLAPANAACPGAVIAFLMGGGMKLGTGMPDPSCSPRCLGRG